MLSFLVLSLSVINLSHSQKKKGPKGLRGVLEGIEEDISAQLSYPLTEVDPDVIKAYGDSFVDAFADFVNKKKNATELGRIMSAKGEKEGNVIYIVDGVEYRNLREFRTFANIARDLFKTGSANKSQEVEVETTVIDANSLTIRGCMDVTLDLDIGIYDASQNITSCGTHTLTFDDAMELIRVEVKSDGGFTGTAINYALQYAVTTILPETEFVYDDDSKLNTKEKKKFFAIPIYVAVLFIIVFITSSIGLCVLLVINITSNNGLPAKEDFL